jgi:hypothetical protein
MEDEVGYDNFVKECDFCGSRNIKMVHEWYDEYYHTDKDDNYNSVVPHEPIGEDEKKCEDHRGNTYYTIVQVYDVSELFEC